MQRTQKKTKVYLFKSASSFKVSDDNVDKKHDNDLFSYCYKNNRGFGNYT